jgi:AraC family transcriptional regulator
VQVQDGKTHTGVYQQGEMLITPAHTPLLVQWEGDENCLQIQLKPEFLQKIARETLDPKEQHLELVSAFQQQDAQLGAIGQMLLREWHQEFSNGQLYLDSLTNILAVNLLRHNLSYHQSTILQLPTYDGGLPQQQLKQVLDYVHGHLDQEIKLETLACLLDMSQFHFSRLFKQSLGISPHQYLLQQRVEQAKQLLKHTDRLIVDIALDCGFNSHSHLSRQFRQLTGVTPKAYRAS